MNYPPPPPGFNPPQGHPQHGYSPAPAPAGYAPGAAGYTPGPGGYAPVPTPRINALGVASLAVAVAFHVLTPLLRMLIMPALGSTSLFILYTLLPLLAGTVGGLFGLLGVLNTKATKYRWMAISGLTLAALGLGSFGYSQLTGWIVSTLW